MRPVVRLKDLPFQISMMAVTWFVTLAFSLAVVVVDVQPASLPKFLMVNTLVVQLNDQHQEPNPNTLPSLESILECLKRTTALKRDCWFNTVESKQQGHTLHIAGDYQGAKHLPTSLFPSSDATNSIVDDSGYSQNDDDQDYEIFRNDYDRASGYGVDDRDYEGDDPQIEDKLKFVPFFFDDKDGSNANNKSRWHEDTPTNSDMKL